MKILKEEKNHHIQVFLKIFGVLFLLLKIVFSHYFKGFFSLYNKGMLYFECITDNVLD